MISGTSCVERARGHFAVEGEMRLWSGEPSVSRPPEVLIGGVSLGELLQKHFGRGCVTNFERVRVEVRVLSAED